MNFLAHLHLADNTPESRLGNLLGDFVKGLPWDERFSDEVWLGIMEHRHLDVFTDKHPAWQSSKARLSEENRRYAGIIIDIFYDYFLHKHWDKFSPDQSVEDFISEVHRNLKTVKKQAPKEVRGVLRKMIRQRWLLGYGHLSGVEATLMRVAKSSPNLAEIRGLESELEKNAAGFEADFLKFYPDAIAKAAELRVSLVADK